MLPAWDATTMRSPSSAIQYGSVTSCSLLLSRPTVRSSTCFIPAPTQTMSSSIIFSG